MYRKPYTAPGAQVLYLNPQATVLAASFSGTFRSKWFSSGDTFTRAASDAVTKGTWGGSGAASWQEDGYKLNP